MLIREAAAMIDCPVLNSSEKPAAWADLGCGAGTFTQALASLLPLQSTIYAVDKVDTLRIEQPVPHWVPYPIKFSLLSELFSDHGFAYCTRLQERPSLYRSANLYSALVQKTRS